jgi:NitT/TauT family transport system ATP-binding protein
LIVNAVSTQRDQGTATTRESELATAAGYLELTGVSKSYSNRERASVIAIKDVDLAVREKEFLAVVGASGCGKSTLLQIAAGLIPPTTGRITLHGRAVDGPPAEMVYLFQQYSKSLLPWRTIIANVAFALERRPGLSRHEIRERSLHYLKLVDLETFSSNYPWQLSGGMQQRVAIARALAAEPRILLMDEPFSSVDALTRLDLQDLLLDLWSRQAFTVLLVTHDVDEAIYLADRVAVMTPRPSSIAEVIDVNLPRPRHPIRTRELERFLDLRHHLLEQLLRSKSEVA